MYMRVIRGRARLGKVEELAARWRELIAPRLAATPEVVHAHFAGNHETGDIVTVSVWRSRPDVERLGRELQAFVEQVRELAASAPVVEDYEVFASVSSEQRSAAPETA